MSSPVDRGRALEILGGDREVYVELLEMLASEASENSVGIESAIAEGNARVAERLAHSLKGASANMAAEPLREIAGELEQLGRIGDLNTARQRLNILHERVEALIRFVQEETGAYNN
jgi:HPt (histidine-containing phosphotransfer) domain-containing protein